MLISLNKKPTFFFERFQNGKCVHPNLPKITTEESAKQFQPRKSGLKILLINPAIRLWSMPNILCIGQAYIASVAIMDGHKIFPLDLNAERKKPVDDEEQFKKYSFSRIEEEINKINPDLIGIGGIITQYKRIKEITTFCKNFAPKIPIVLGGGIATSSPRFMMERLPIDFLIVEEGEITFSEFLYRLENKTDMKGCQNVWFKDENGEIIANGKRPSVIDGEFGLDCLPWPARHLWDVENVYKVNPVGHLNWESKWNEGKLEDKHSGKFSLSILGTRGCKFNCLYCYKSYLTDGYQKRTPFDVVSEMKYLKQKYSVSYVHFLDDLFLTDWKWSLSFFNEIKNQNLDIEWGATARTNIIYKDKLRAEKQKRPHILELAYETGMRQGCFGVESASPSVLKAIDKSGQTQETIAWTAKEAMRIFGYFDSSYMIGNIGETKETIQETIDFCKKSNISVETIFFAQSFPGTPYWEEALKRGLIGEAVKGYKCEANDDIIEEYFMKLGESSENVLTNFSKTLSNEDLIKMGANATEVLSSMNKRHPGLKKEPHTGDLKKTAVAGNFADL